MQNKDELGDLVGGGLCFSHYHQPNPISHEDIVNSQYAHIQKTVTGNITLTTEDLILANTSSNSITVTLPKSGGAGKEFIVFKTHASNTVTINPVGADTINGGASLTITASYGSYWLKAVSGGWVAR